MRLNENSTFIIFMIGIFCLMLGSAVLIFSLVEWAFFELSYKGPLAAISILSIGLGAALISSCRQGIE